MKLFTRFQSSLVVAIISGVTSAAQQSSTLSQVDSLLSENQDSLAWSILKDYPHQNQQEEIWKAKLKGDYYFGQGEYIKAVSEYRSLYTDEFDTSNEDLTLKVAKGINDMGILYFRLSQPDSAILAHQKSIELYQIHNDHQGQAFNYNNLALVYSRLEKWDTVTYLYQASLDQATLANDTIGIGFNHLNLGVHHHNQSNFVKAIDHYERSREVFQQYGNESLVMRVNRKLYGFYINLKDYETALPILYKVKNYYEANPNKFVLSRVYKDIAQAHQNHFGNLDSTKYYIQRGLEATDSTNDPDGYYVLQWVMGDVLISEEKYGEALQLFKSIYDSSDYHYARIVSANSLANTYLKLKDFEDAIRALDAYQSFDSVTIRNEYWLTFYDILHQAHMSLGNTEKAQEYYELFKSYEEKVFDREKNMEVARIEYRNVRERELALQKAREEKLQLEIERRQLIIIGSSVLLLLLIIMIIVIYRSNQRKQRHNQQLAHKNIELNKLRESERNMAVNEKMLLQESLDAKDRQLASTTMLSLEKNKMIEELDHRLKTLEGLDLVKVKEEVQQMKRILRAHMSMETSWETFAFQFEQVHPNFFKKIEERFPDTTINDRKICAYIRIGFGNNEIAQVTNLTLAAVKKSVNRLKKRLGLKADDNLRDFISKL